MSQSATCSIIQRPVVAKWCDAGNGWVPENRLMRPLIGGSDVGGEYLFVGRSSHQGDLIPGKVNQRHGVCYISHNGKEIANKNYQILVSIEQEPNIKFQWIPSNNGQIPSNAIQGGVTADGEPLFIGRARHEGSVAIGKISPRNNSLLIPFAGDEVSYTSYECLCIRELFYLYLKFENIESTDRNVDRISH